MILQIPKFLPEPELPTDREQVKKRSKRTEIVNRESQIEARLVKRVKEMGGEVRKVKWIGRNGAPDRIVMLPARPIRHRELADNGRTIWVELKAPGRKPDAHQVREHERMRRMGQRVEVVDSYERIEEILK